MPSKLEGSQEALKFSVFFWWYLLKNLKILCCFIFLPMAHDFLPWSLCFLPVFTNNQEQWKLQMRAQEKHQAKSFFDSDGWKGGPTHWRRMGKLIWIYCWFVRNPAITSWDGAKTIVKNWDFNYQSLIWWVYRICSITTLNIGGSDFWSLGKWCIPLPFDERVLDPRTPFQI